MIVHNFNVMRIAIPETKTDSPLLVDADTPLTTAISRQPLQPVARWRTQIGNIRRRVKHLQLSFGLRLNRPEPARTFPRKQQLRVPAGKRANHEGTLKRHIFNVNR